MLVGLVLNNLLNATFHVVAEVLQQRLGEQGYRVILCVTGADVDLERQYIDMLGDQQVDGVVIIGTGRNLARLRALTKLGTPVVSLIRAADNCPGDRVLAADQEGGYAATVHLLERGHRRIGYIGGAAESNSGRERFAGYRQALAEAGVEVDDSLVLRGPFQEQFGREAISQLLGLPRAPTAVYAANHEASFGVLPKLHEIGVRVPEDLSIVCHDEAPWFRHWHPAITIVDSGATQLAELAADRLLSAMAGTTTTGSQARTYRVGARLVERSSTATYPVAAPGTGPEGHAPESRASAGRKAAE
jgi:LacI family transcriptional regulator